MSADLMSAFQYTAEDLSYNRRGELSPGQAGRLKRSYKQGGILFFVLVPACAAGAYFILSPFLLQDLPLEENLGKLVGGLVLSALALFFLYLSVALFFDRDRPIVRQVEGEARLVSRESDTTDPDGLVTTYSMNYLVIGEQEFSLEAEKQGAFQHGHRYRIFHERFLGILSVEYLGPPIPRNAQVNE